MAQKKKKGVNLNKILNNIIESNINKLLEKQIYRFKVTIPEMKKSVKDLENKLTKIYTIKKTKRKLEKKVKSKPVRNARIKNIKICKIKGCNEPRRAKGLCNKHYVAALRKGKKSKKGRK